MKQLMLTPKDYVGKTEEEATIIAESKGFIVRVTEKDGRGKPLSMEVRSDRVNFRLKNGRVIEAYGG